MKKWNEPKMYILSVAYTQTDLETPVFDATPVFDSSPLFEDRPRFTTSPAIEITTGSGIIVDTGDYESSVAAS